MKWKNELYNHEVKPPDKVWEKIVHDLDDDFYHFRNKLYHAEIAPPENCWQQIQKELNPATVVSSPFFTINKIFRITAAAAIIGMCFYAANYFLVGRYETAITEQKELRPANQERESVPITNKNESQGITAPQSEKPLIASRTEKRKNVEIRKPHSVTVPDFYINESAPEVPGLSSISKNNSAFSDRYALDHDASKQIRNLKGEIREDVRLMDLPNSYFLMTGPNGQSVRVSSKFRNTIQYLNASDKEELLDVILRESRFWRNQFKTWKEEVGHSDFIPSANNFMDITALMKLLQQHQTK